MTAIPRRPPLLRGLRLTLEPLCPDHAAPLFAGLSDPALYRFLSDRPPSSLAELSEHLAEHAGRSEDGAELWCSWMVRDGDGRYVGTAQATIERAGEQAGAQAGGRVPGEPATGLIGIMVFPPFWRRGIATEALSCLLDCLFERYGCDLAAALVDTRNEASLALFARLGFETARLILDADFFDDRISHEVELVLQRVGWRERGRTG